MVPSSLVQVVSCQCISQSIFYSGDLCLSDCPSTQSEDHSTISNGCTNLFNHSGKQFNSFEKEKSRNGFTSRHFNNTPANIPKDALLYHMGNCSTIFIGALFLIVNIQKKTKAKIRCPSAEIWIKKMWYIYIVEYYLVVKINGVMKVAYNGMELEIIISS